MHQLEYCYLGSKLKGLYEHIKHNNSESSFIWELYHRRDPSCIVHCGVERNQYHVSDRKHGDAHLSGHREIKRFS